MTKQKFKVEVTRYYSVQVTVEVTADNEEEAKQLGITKANNEDFKKNLLCDDVKAEAFKQDVSDDGVFYCKKCKTKHKQSMYATAQIAMGHGIVFTCPECGEKRDF